MKKFFKIFFISIGVVLLLFVGLFFLIRKMDKNAGEMNDFDSSTYESKTPRLLPSSFINGERFYIKMPAANGDTILAFGDTGGGLCMLMPGAVDKLGLRSKVKTALLKGIMPIKYVLFSDVVRDQNIPAPGPLRHMILRRPLARVTEPFLFIPPLDEETRFLTETMALDAFLGQNFFMGKSWTFDYPHQQVWVNTPIPASSEGKPGVQKLGFKKNDNHQNVFGHPSMYIEVDSERIDVLFDAGATIALSENGKKSINRQEKTIGGSFIAASIFDKWRKKHPDWKYYEKADMARDVIEVPFVNIGGYSVGPVLFAKRDDVVWSEGMISSMDKVVKGAIGGSGLKFLKVTIDYNSELIKFER